MGQSCYKWSECNFRKRGRTENVFHLCLFFHHHNFVLNLPLEWKELYIKCHLCLSSSSLSLCERRSVVSDCLRPHGLYSPWNSPGQNTEVGSLSLLQGIFQTQGLNPGLPHGRQILYQLSHKGSPRILEWAAYPSPVDFPDPGIELGSPAPQAHSLATELWGKPLLPLWSYMFEWFTHVLCCENYNEIWGVWFKYEYECIYGRITNTQDSIVLNIFCR